MVVVLGEAGAGFQCHPVDVKLQMTGPPGPWIVVPLKRGGQRCGNTTRGGRNGLGDLARDTRRGNGA